MEDGLSFMIGVILKAKVLWYSQGVLERGGYMNKGTGVGKQEVEEMRSPWISKSHLWN